MTDRILVDFNSRDERGYIPASRRRLTWEPSVGSLVDAVDNEDNRCLAFVVRVGSTSVALEPLWQTFATSDQPRVLPELPSATYRLTLANATSIFVAPAAAVWPEQREQPLTSGGAERVPAR